MAGESMDAVARRGRLKTIAAATLALGTRLVPSAVAAQGIHQDRTETRMRLVTLSFDDGFRKSFLKTAQIYEKHGLKACFNVIASAHLPGFVPPHDSLAGLGDFGLWRELAARGHEIMPHGYRHENLAKMPLAEARELTLRCLDVFEKELPGFARRKAVYSFPYNASTPEIEAWLPTVVRAFRTGWEPINPLPGPDTVRITCASDGPESAEGALDAAVTGLLSRPSGWLVFNTHGLDGEGWGPIGSDYLDRLLDRLLNIATVRIMPAGAALDEFGRKNLAGVRSAAPPEVLERP